MAERRDLNRERRAWAEGDIPTILQFQRWHATEWESQARAEIRVMVGEWELDQVLKQGVLYSLDEYRNGIAELPLTDEWRGEDL